MTRSTEKRILRCAIYTRKSSEEGLEQGFNSLHAQRESCEAYIKSQKHEGWTVLPTTYDDDGRYSGGTMERPALKQLLGHVQSGAVAVVVVYKVDRLTRSTSRDDSGKVFIVLMRLLTNPSCLDGVGSRRSVFDRHASTLQTRHIACPTLGQKETQRDHYRHFAARKCQRHQRLAIRRFAKSGRILSRDTDGAVALL